MHGQAEKSEQRLLILEKITALALGALVGWAWGAQDYQDTARYAVPQDEPSSNRNRSLT